MPDFNALRESHACESVSIHATGQQTLRATIAIFSRMMNPFVASRNDFLYDLWLLLHCR
jgi:hypothetical protein